MYIDFMWWNFTEIKDLTRMICVVRRSMNEDLVWVCVKLMIWAVPGVYVYVRKIVLMVRIKVTIND